MQVYKYIYIDLDLNLRHKIECNYINIFTEARLVFCSIL